MTKKTRRRRKGKSIFRRVPSHLLWGLLVIVVAVYIFFFYKTFIGPYSFRWKAIYGDTNYPEGTVRGIDISHYQQDIDWERVRNASIQGSPVRFVFIKATEGTDKFDPNFNLNFYQARAICDYRRLKGPLHSLDDLKMLPEFPADVIARLRPYVSFE